MSDNKRRKRLDEILLDEGMITESQVRDALLRQKAQGGKFGSQLLYHRYLDEATLVEALEIQFGCKGVILSRYDIPEAVCGMLPRRVAVARKAVPFEFDAHSNTLKVACEDPTDQKVTAEVSGAAQGKNIEFFVAAELALNTAIAKYYLKQNVSLNDNLLLDIPDALADTSRGISIVTGESGSAEERKKILLATDDGDNVEPIQSILQRDGYDVVVERSTDKALGRVRVTKFRAVLVKDTLPDGHIDFLDMLRKVLPSTAIHYYHCPSSLILNTQALVPDADMLVKNHDLVTSLLSSTAAVQASHSNRVGRYADRLCQRLGLPDADRFSIVNAAYLHDFARYYYHIDETVDNRRVIDLTVRLLASTDYQPVVVDILRSTYGEVQNQSREGLPIASIGGSILTIADLFCDSIPDDNRLSVSRLDAVKKRLGGLSGTLFFTDVAESFIKMIQDEFLDRHAARTKPQVMVYCEDPLIRQTLDQRLRREGFRTIIVDSQGRLAELYRRSGPDMMIFSFGDDGGAIDALFTWMNDQGISVTATPTFLLVDPSLRSRLTKVPDVEVVDIIAGHSDLDLLFTRLNKLRAKRDSESSNARSGRADEPGARGHLTDMNIIDLIQALGPGLKTVRISVKPDVRGAGTLVLYLNEGAIVYAELNELTGVEAVYEGLTWTDGVWSIDSVAQTDIPHPNINVLNDSILMEGCRLLDERVRAGVPL